MSFLNNLLNYSSKIIATQLTNPLTSIVEGLFLFEFSKRAVCEIINITRKIRPNSYIDLNLFTQDDHIFLSKTI